MEAIFFFIGLFIFITFFVPWVNVFRLGGLRDEVERLSYKVHTLEAQLRPGVFEEKKEVRALEPEKEVPEVKYDSFFEEPKSEDFKSVSRTVPQVKKASVKKDKISFEQNIATRLPVWIGGVALICAAFYLVKYSIEVGLLGPGVRLMLGGVFGVALVGAGQWLVRRPQIANGRRMSQALTGAGLVTLYVCIYAAVNLYGFIAPMPGFIGMAAVTAAAVLLSFAGGQPIAVFGLIGGLLTPALIGSEDPNALMLFGYLFLLFSGTFYVLLRNGWWGLSIVALLGVFCWSGFWYMTAFSDSDAPVLILFALAVCGVVLAATRRDVTQEREQDRHQANLPAHSLNVLAIAGGAVTVILLSFRIELSLFDWSVLGLFSAALLALSYFQPLIYRSILWLKLGAVLTVFTLWAGSAPLSSALAVMAGFSALYVVVPYILMRRVFDPRFWAALQVVTAVSFYLLSYLVLDLPESFAAPFGMFWGVLSLVLASLAIYQAHSMRMNYKADQGVQDHLVAIYALATTAFISLGLFIEVPRVYVPVAFAAQAAVTGWIYWRSGIDFLRNIMGVLTVLVLAMYYEQIWLFGSTFINAFFGEYPNQRFTSRLLLENPFVNLGASAAFLILTLMFRIGRDRTVDGLTHLMFASGVFLSLATYIYYVRGIFNPGAANVFALEPGFIERGFIEVSFAALGLGLVTVAERFDLHILQKWGVWLFNLSLLHIVYFEVLVHNPYYDRSQDVGALPVLNGVSMVYGAGLMLSLLALFRKEVAFGGRAMERAYAVSTFGFFFLLVSLNIRQYFQGGNLAGGVIGSVEFYSYSVAWLVCGLGLLGAGMLKDSKALRVGSLLFMLLTVVKVFVFDAGELEGLYRVFSFLGLGLSLIGLSYFYTRFLLKQGKSV